MTMILQILVSPRPQAWSRRFAGDIVGRIAALCPGARVITRDLAADPPPHPERDLYEAILSPTPDDDPRFALSERYIGELEAADVVVIGTPVNNFTVPSTLKAWVDHIVRIRRTFRSTPDGKIGLLRDRPVPTKLQILAHRIFPAWLRITKHTCRSTKSNRRSTRGLREFVDRGQFGTHISRFFAPIRCNMLTYVSF